MKISWQRLKKWRYLGTDSKSEDILVETQKVKISWQRLKKWRYLGRDSKSEDIFLSVFIWNRSPPDQLCVWNLTSPSCLRRVGKNQCATTTVKTISQQGQGLEKRRHLFGSCHSKWSSRCQSCMSNLNIACHRSIACHSRVGKNQYATTMQLMIIEWGWWLTKRRHLLNSCHSKWPSAMHVKSKHGLSPQHHLSQQSGEKIRMQQQCSQWSFSKCSDSQSEDILAVVVWNDLHTVSHTRQILTLLITAEWKKNLWG